MMRWTTKTLAERLQVDEDRAAKVKGLINKEIDPEDFKSVQDWVRRCYHKPRDTELRMCAIDEVLETCGVEAVRGEDLGGYYGEVRGTYCNTGDMYTETVFFRSRDQRFMISSCGNFK